jgi:hypothetical protein
MKAVTIRPGELTGKRLSEVARRTGFKRAEIARVGVVRFLRARPDDIAQAVLAERKGDAR